MKKILALIIFIILLIIILFYGEFQQQVLLRKEVQKIFKLNWNTENIDMQVKTKGGISEIEIIIKEYYKELYEYRKEYDSLKLYDLCSDTLSAQQLKKVDLNNSKENITNLYNQKNNVSDKIIKIVDNKYITGLIKNKDIKKHHVWIYKRYMISNDDKIINNWNEEIQNNKLIYELTIKAIDVLIENKNVWHVENGKLYFKDANVLEQYNNFVSKLNNLEESDK